MKQIIQQLLSCLILSVVFCTTAWADTGLSFLEKNGESNFYKYVGDETTMVENATFYIEMSGSTPYFRAYTTDSNNPLWLQWGTGAKNFSAKLTAEDVTKLKANNYEITIVVSAGECTNASFSTGTGGTGGTVTPPTPATLADKIKNHEQITNIPTIYLTVPDALNADGTAKDINSVLFKTGNVAEYHAATIQVVDNSGQLENFTDNKLEIKVRGNSTAGDDKKPYRLKFAKDSKDAAGKVIETHKHDLLGTGFTTGPKRNWTLLTNHKDASLLHNALTYHVGKAVDMDFCPGYRFVDLVINGEYRGNYQISDHVEVGKNRIDVDEDTGWFVEAARSGMEEDPKVYAAGLYMTVKSPDYDLEKQAAEVEKIQADIKKYFDDLNYYWGVYHNNPCSFEDFINPKTGWRAYIDEESLVKFYVGINLTDDYDGFMTVKMYREVDGKLKFGPLWDKDLAYGNWENHGKLCEEYQNGYTFSDHMQRMMTDPYFVKKVYEKLHAVVDAGFISNMQEKIYSMGTEIAASQALNYNQWYTGSDYSAEQKKFADYIEEHTNYVVGRIDEIYGNIDWTTVPTFPDTPDDPDDDDTPTGDLGALKDLGEGKYSYTGSASTFKEGTVITITTSTASTTLSNYITEGNTWNTTKTITLTAADVTALANSENKYTFFMQATGGEVKAVNVKVPVASAGAEFNKEYSISTETNEFLVPASYFNANATSVKIIFKNNTNNYSSGWNGRFAFNGTPNANDAGQIPWTLTQTYEYTLKDATKIQSAAQLGMGVAVQPSAMTVTVINYGTSQEETTPTYTLTLSAASEGGTVSGAGTYAEGTTVLIKAIPNEGYKFVKWSDDNTYASRSVTLKDADITLTATFAAEGSTDEDPFNEQGARKQLTDLPTIYLDATTINGEWLEAAVEVFDKDNKLYQGANWSKAGVSKKGNINVAVQYQGSGADDSKNSYRLKFNDKINLLSATGLYKQWVLLANDDDPTMLNNALAKELGDAIGMPWTPGYQFVDLYVNGTYMGTYQLTDRVKAEEGRSLVSEGNKDADWQLRFNDNTELAEDGTQDYISGSGVNVIYRNPDPKDITPEALEILKSNLRTYFNSFFAETATNTFANIPGNVDQQQLINWYIAQEILGVYKGFSSIEAYRSITEGAADNLLHFGPLWDSEKGFGNTGEAPAINMGDLNTSGSHKGLMIEYSAFPKMNKIFNYLWTLDWFKSGVKTKWDAIKTTLPTSLAQTITTLKGTIAQSQALNAQKWNNSLGSYASYDDALTATNTYITNRFEYLDKKFNELAGAAHVHSYTEYIDNGDGTHSRKCTADNEVEEGSEIHTLIVNANGKAACSVCNLEIEGTSNMGNTDEKVYILDAGTSKVQYISKSTGFTPIANNVYKINEKPEEGTVFDNVYWLGADGKTNYADKIVVDDSAPWNVNIQILAKEATHTRSTAAASIWGTVCLPFKTISNDDVTLFKLSSVSVDEEGKGTMVFIEAASTGGLTPLVFKKKNSSATSVKFTSEAQTDNTDPAKNGYVTVKATAKMNKNKSASKDPLPTGWEYYGNVQEKQTVTANADGNPALYFISSNKFYRATSTLKVSPFRAYFEYTAPTAEAKIATFIIADEEATEITTTLNEKNSLAIFTTTGGVNIVAPKDMTINIYTAAGALAKRVAATANDSQYVALPSGMYVINGAKFVIK